MTYQLRRLRLRSLIIRIPGTQCYEVTDSGQRMALFWLGSLSKTIRPLATTLTDETVQQKILIQIKKTIERNAMAAANSKNLTHLLHVSKGKRSYPRINFSET